MKRTHSQHLLTQQPLTQPGVQQTAPTATPPTFRSPFCMSLPQQQLAELQQQYGAHTPSLATPPLSPTFSPSTLPLAAGAHGQQGRLQTDGSGAWSHHHLLMPKQQPQQQQRQTCSNLAGAAPFDATAVISRVEGLSAASFSSAWITCSDSGLSRQPSLSMRSDCSFAAPTRRPHRLITTGLDIASGSITSGCGGLGSMGGLDMLLGSFTSH